MTLSTTNGSEYRGKGTFWTVHGSAKDRRLEVGDFQLACPSFRFNSCLGLSDEG